MKIEFQWKVITWHEGFSNTSRAKVIGGWLVKNETFDCEVGTYAQSESMVFVPDINHEWEIIEVENE